MAIVVTDASSGIYNWLKTHANAASLRALIYNGATNVLEEGDLTPTMLEDDARARDTASERSKVLAVTVHDAGERGSTCSVTIRIWDRQEGYRNIRAWRDLFLSVWYDSEEANTFALTAVNGKKRGLLFLEYAGRTGHFRPNNFVADVEAVALSGKLMVEDDD